MECVMERINPFDDEKAQFHVLVNVKQQYSLWPDFCPWPAGWQRVFGPAPHKACGEWLDAHWLTLCLPAVCDAQQNASLVQESKK